jgi:hypothetical protein
MKDLTGTVFGEQVVISFSHRKGGTYYWNVLCKCGKLHLVSGNILNRGESKSCGCNFKFIEPGQRYGRLTVLSLYEGDRSKYKSRSKRWVCECDCGSVVTVSAGGLTSGHTQSCGCLQKERQLKAVITHGEYKSDLYGVFWAIKERCLNLKCSAYKWYGGRGIKICAEWNSDYEVFKEWAHSNGYKKGLQIDRIDNDGDYCPENCRWVTSKDNNRNTRYNKYITYEGKTQCFSAWAEELNMRNAVVRDRFYRGLPLDKVLYPYDLKTGKRLLGFK